MLNTKTKPIFKMPFLINIYIALHVYNMCLFFRKFYLIHDKELKSCRDCQLFNHTVPVASRWRQFTRI